MSRGGGVVGTGGAGKGDLVAVGSGGEGEDEEEVAIQAVAQGLDAQADSPLEASV